MTPYTPNFITPEFWSELAATRPRATATLLSECVAYEDWPAIEAAIAGGLTQSVFSSDHLFALYGGLESDAPQQGNKEKLVTALPYLRQFVSGLSADDRERAADKLLLHGKWPAAELLGVLVEAGLPWQYCFSSEVESLTLSFMSTNSAHGLLQAILPRTIEEVPTVRAVGWDLGPSRYLEHSLLEVLCLLAHRTGEASAKDGWTALQLLVRRCDAAALEGATQVLARALAAAGIVSLDRAKGRWEPAWQRVTSLLAAGVPFPPTMAPAFAELFANGQSLVEEVSRQPTWCAVPALRALVSAGCDLDAAVRVNRATPLQQAVINSNALMASNLLEAGADPEAGEGLNAMVLLEQHLRRWTEQGNGAMVSAWAPLADRMRAEVARRAVDSVLARAEARAQPAPA